MKQKRPRNPVPTKMQLAFISCYEGNNGPEAAKAAGYKDGRAGQELLAKPHVRKLIDAKMQAAAQASGKDLAKQGAKLWKSVAISRNDIINRLDKLSQNSEIDSVKVGALRVLADIFQLTPKGKNDADLFSGWTEEELDHYRLTGQLPARFGLSPDTTDGNPNSTSVPPAHGPDVGTSQGERSTPKKA